MLYELFPQGALTPDANDCSIQSLLFGHRIKPQQTRYEYLAEFLQIAMAKKRLVDDDSQPTDEMFIIDDKVKDHMIEYTPISNMGLKRFIFFDNSRLDTKSPIDDDAYKKCVKIMSESIEQEATQLEDKEAIFVLQNILYGFSIENAGRSWFNKNLLPVCPEVLFPESLARKGHRERASIDSVSTDNCFDFNSYTYMARGGEIYYLHLLHALNNAETGKKELLEKQIKRMLSGIPQLSKISEYIQQKWEDEMDFYDRDTDKPAVKKTMKAIPLDYQYRDKPTISELITFLDNRIQPMEKIDLLSYGIVIQIITKLNGKITENAVKVLRAILICNILKFSFYDRNSALNCVRLCSGLSEEDTIAAISGLENEYCVITYDTDSNRFDLNAEAHGKQEYTICIMKKMTMLRGYDPIEELDEELSNELRLITPVSTAFSQENNISSPEWQYNQMLINVSKINEMYCRSLIAKVKEAIDGETYRGILVFLYCGKTSERDIPIVTKLIKTLEIQKLPIVFCLLYDEEEKWVGYLKRRAVFRKFTESEKEMYARFLGKESRAIIRTISSEFTRMAGEKKILTDKGIETLTGRINQYCYDKFKKCYPNVIPFSFTEFEKKPTPTAKKTLLSMCRNMIAGTMCNKQSYQGLDPTEKRRIVTALHTQTPATSWQVFDANYNLCEPRNSKVKKIFQEVMEKFSADSQHTIGQLFGNYRYAPYGLNYYSLYLFIIYVLSLNIKKISLFDGTVLMTKQQFIDNYLQSDRKMLENLMKLRVVLKTQTDDEVLTDLIKDIKQLVYTERCPEYSKQLKALVETSENIDSIKGEIAACEMKLQQGVNYNTSKYGFLTKVENAIDQCRSTFSLIQIVSVLTSIEKPEVDSKIEEYSDYLYSPTYVARVDKILTEATKILDENFSPFVAKLKCAYSQSSEFKKKYQQTAKRLQELGKKEYASILKTRIEVVLQEAELEQKYAATIADARRFISAIDNSVHTFDFPKCAETTAQLSGWVDTFRAADDMVSSVRDDFIGRLREAQDKVNTQTTQLSKQIQQVLKEIEEPSESYSLLSEHISKAIRINPDEKALIILTNAQNLIEEFARVRSSIVQADNSIIENLEEEYNSKWKGTVCDRYMVEYIASLRENQDQKRKDWLRKNVVNVKESISAMTTSQCVQWQGIMSDLPEFLTNSDLKEITELSSRITEIIKSQRINGVIEMFSALTVEEKQECLRRLQEVKYG